MFCFVNQYDENSFASIHMKVQLYFCYITTPRIFRISFSFLNTSLYIKKKYNNISFISLLFPYKNTHFINWLQIRIYFTFLVTKKKIKHKIWYFLLNRKIVIFFHATLSIAKQHKVYSQKIWYLINKKKKPSEKLANKEIYYFELTLKKKEDSWKYP